MSDSLIPWTAALQAPLFSTISQSLHKFMSVESMMLSNHLILCLLLQLPSVLPRKWSFPVNWLFTSVAKVLEVQLHQHSFQWISGLVFFRTDGLTSLQSKGLSRVFSSTTIWKHQFFGAQPSLWIHIEHYQHLNPSQSFPIIILLSCNDSLNFMKGNTFSKVMYCTL